MECRVFAHRHGDEFPCRVVAKGMLPIWKLKCTQGHCRRPLEAIGL